MTHYKVLFISLIASFIGYSDSLFSQVGEGGMPSSFVYQKMMRSTPSATHVPIHFNVDDLRETDTWLAREAVPMPVSKLIPVDYNMENAGFHTVLPDGTDIWRLHLKAKDAIAIMLYYNDFYIPEGGRLFIYSPDQSQVLGAYTHQTHPSGGFFATEFIGGDELILEYVSSKISDDRPRISIHDIGYGYNTAALRTFCGITTRASGVGGDCEVNINCEEGDAWQNEKKGICHTIQRVAGIGYICTGSLMNNTAQDLSPLILTAVHCAYNDSFTTKASESDLLQWMFYFNMERENCSNSSMSKVTKTIVGCKLLVSTGLSGGSDGLLLLLNDTIPTHYDVYYNGWDINDANAFSGVCIHHPRGDYKKISTFDEPTKTYSYQDENISCDKNAHLNVIFKATPNGHGVTEGGSSGSPLFNENKLIIGTLTGGNSSCTAQRGLNIYGKLSYHWDKYKTDSMHMDVWLDPLNTGVKSFHGRFRKELKPAPTNLNIINLGLTILLTWDVPQGPDEPLYYNVYRNNSKLNDTIALSYVDQNPILGSIVYSVSAVYANNEESAFSNKSIAIIKYKPPTDLKAERISETSDYVQLSWKAPEYEQTIFWGTLLPKRMVGFDENFPFYYGQKWTADEIQPLHKTKIKAIQFYPIKDNSYEIYITQGAHDYQQPIDDASLKTNSLNTVELSTPFTIDGSMSLIVSIYISSVRSTYPLYPAVTDNGPLVSGKGNLCSVDGLDWWELNEGEAPGDFEYNFVVAAIISSEFGDFSTRSYYNNTPKSKRGMRLVPSDLNLRNAVLTLNDQPVSTRNSVPAAFPEITKHRIYRSGSHYKDVIAPETTFTDTYVAQSTYYQVSAIYDRVESDKSERANISIVDNDEITGISVQISPTYFSDFITLQGNELIKKIEFISLSGTVCLIVAQPGQQINTTSLSPGLYVIRISDVHERQHVVKAIRR